MTEEQAIARIRNKPYKLGTEEFRPWKNNKRVVMAAVSQWGRVLEYASATLKNDKEIVMVATKQDRSVLKHAGLDIHKASTEGAVGGVLLESATLPIELTSRISGFLDPKMDAAKLRQVCRVSRQGAILEEVAERAIYSASASDLARTATSDLAQAAGQGRQ